MPLPNSTQRICTNPTTGPSPNGGGGWLRYTPVAKPMVLGLDMKILSSLEGRKRTAREFQMLDEQQNSSSDISRAGYLY